jgi:hypothetical protein
MTGWASDILLSLGGLVGTLLFLTFGDLVSEEIRGWLDMVPRALLRLAAVQLDPEKRATIYDDEWLPELCYILRGAESRPVTRLIRGIRFAVGLIISAHHIARRLDRTPALAQAASAQPLSDAESELARLRADSDWWMARRNNPNAPPLSKADHNDLERWMNTLANAQNTELLEPEVATFARLLRAMSSYGEVS